MKSASHRIRPLEWPEKWLKRTSFQNFLRGIPFVGIDRKVLKDFRDQIAERDETCLELWDKDNDLIQVRDEVSLIIQEEMEWANAYFIPEDNLGILMWEPTMESREMNLLYRLKDDPFYFTEFCDSVSSNLKNIKYGNFIKFVVAQRVH